MCLSVFLPKRGRNEIFNLDVKCLSRAALAPCCLTLIEDRVSPPTQWRPASGSCCSLFTATPSSTRLPTDSHTDWQHTKYCHRMTWTALALTARDTIPCLRAGLAEKRNISSSRQVKYWYSGYEPFYRNKPIHIERSIRKKNGDR